MLLRSQLASRVGPGKQPANFPKEGLIGEDQGPPQLTDLSRLAAVDEGESRSSARKGPPRRKPQLHDESKAVPGWHCGHCGHSARSQGCLPAHRLPRRPCSSPEATSPTSTARQPRPGRATAAWAWPFDTKGKSLSFTDLRAKGCGNRLRAAFSGLPLCRLRSIRNEKSRAV